MKLIDLVQGSDSWHEFRKGKIGASIVPVIMGVSPYQTKLQLFNEVMQISKPKEYNEAMKRGHDLEPIARDWCKSILKLDDLEPVVVQHDQFDWAIASLDGYSPSKKIIVEIKCPKRSDHLLALQGEIPTHYYPQLQHQMFVTDEKTCTYVSFDGKDGTIVICERNEDYIHKMILEEMDFLARVELNIPPDPCQNDEVIIDDPLMISLSSEYQFLMEEIESMEREREKIKQMIVERCSHSKNRIGLLKVAKNMRQGNIDYKRIPELKGMNLEAYRKPCIEYWEISK